MAHPAKLIHLSIEEYLEMEERSDIRHEYVEVLSPSTATIDRREKLAAYGQLDSIREYVVIHQDRRCIELHRKNEAGKWQTAILGEQNDLVLDSLPTGAFTLTMEEIYEDVIFPVGVSED